MTKILQKDEKLLRNMAKPVLLEELHSPRIKKIINEMKTAMNAEEDAVAIAAPQIGVPLRIFIVSGKILAQQKKSFETADFEKDTKQIQKTTPPQDLIFINPEIIKRSQKKKWVEEGCLSVRWLYGEVKRSERATIKAFNENGEQFIRGGSGMLAQIFEHEAEHLDGILFTDKARNVKDVPPAETK